MGYYHIKNIDIDKKKGIITAYFADSNCYPISYWKSEIKGNTLHEKYSYLLYDIITGNCNPNSSSKYSVLCNTWSEPALKNFTGDCGILGVEKAYDKYKNVIDAILEHKQPEIIKSEIELHYEIDYGENKDYENLSQNVRTISNFTKGIRNNKNLSHKDRLEIITELEKKLGISFPLVTMIGVEHSTKMYLNFNITNDDYASYKITVENTETGTSKSYQSENMDITWITDYSESEMAYKIQNYEKKFLIYQKCLDFLKEKVYSQSSQNIKLSINSLNIKDDEIRILLDILSEDERTKNYEYDNKTKEIIFNPTIEKELDVVDEMYG